MRERARLKERQQAQEEALKREQARRQAQEQAERRARIRRGVLGFMDRIIVGAFLGLGAVANYQAAAKVAEILRMFAHHLDEAVSPAAAHLRARGDKAGLRDLLLRTSRFNFLIVTPIYLLGAVYMAPVIGVLTGMDTVPTEIWLVGQLLLFFFRWFWRGCFC